MAEFKSWRSYWLFEHAIKTRTRYVYDPDGKEFLDAVFVTAGRRVETVTAAAYFWRAQLGNDLRQIYAGEECVADEPVPHAPERMKPAKDRSKEGRANPKGITYLYLATNRDTALAEVRPWIGSLVSVGQFKTLHELRIVNCTTEVKGHWIYIDREPPPTEREESVWADIDRAFAKPVDPSDDLADYGPTQVLAELFKTSGFDGIAYRSSLGPGHNIALFDINAAEVVNCFLYKVENLKFDFKEAANPYFMTKRDEIKAMDEAGG